MEYKSTLNAITYPTVNEMQFNAKGSNLTNRHVNVSYK